MAAWGTSKRGIDDLVAKVRSGETGRTLLVLTGARHMDDDASVAALCDAVAASDSLEELLCSGHRMSPSMAACFGRALSQNASVKLLALGDATFDDTCLASLLAGWSNQTLETLDLECKRLGSGMAPLSAVLRLPAGNAIRSLKLGRNQLGDAGAAELAEGVAASPHLTHLDVSSNGIGVAGCAALGAALAARPAGPLALDLSRNAGVGAEGVAALCGAATPASACRVVELAVGHCDVGTAGAVAICASATALPLFSELRRLDLASNDVDASAAAPLCEALAAPAGALQVLDLRNNALGVRGSALLTGALGASSLRHLDLTSNGVAWSAASSDELAQVFTDVATKAPALEELRLMGNELGDEGAVRLLRALHDGGSALHTLAIGAAGVTAVGCVQMADMLTSSSTLLCLELGGNDVGADGRTAIEALRDARPELAIPMDDR